MMLCQSLNELDGLCLSKNHLNLDSGLIQRCEEASNKKLSELTPEDLRLLIGQSMGLKYTIPLALELLEKNPFISGELFIGDLLLAVLKTPTEFWKTHIELFNRMVDVASEVEIVYSTINDEILPLIDRFHHYS